MNISHAYGETSLPYAPRYCDICSISIQLDLPSFVTADVSLKTPFACSDFCLSYSKPKKPGVARDAMQASFRMNFNLHFEA